MKGVSWRCVYAAIISCKRTGLMALLKKNWYIVKFVCNVNIQREKKEENYENDKQVWPLFGLCACECIFQCFSFSILSRGAITRKGWYIFFPRARVIGRERQHDLDQCLHSAGPALCPQSGWGWSTYSTLFLYFWPLVVLFINPLPWISCVIPPLQSPSPQPIYWAAYHPSPSIMIHLLFPRGF